MMTRAARLSILGLTLALAVMPSVTAEAAASRGVLRGVVRDYSGAPLVGATIAIFSTASRSTKPVSNVTTDGEGAFAASIAPGRYLLKAVAAGFDTFEARARVAPNRETILDQISMRRVDTFADQQRANSRDPYRQVVRSSRGHVFHVVDPDDEEARDRANATLALTDEGRSTHGIVQTIAASGDRAYLATNFAVANAEADTDWTLVGQLGSGPGAPQRIEARLRNDIGERHEVDVALGYGRLLTDPDRPQRRLDQYTIQAVDRWQAAGPLVVLYGVNYTKFSGASSKGALLPRVGVEFSPSNRSQIFARLTPGSSYDEVASFDLETGEVKFVDSPTAPVATRRLAEARPDRSRRIEIGGGHLIDERSNFEVMAFFDTASGHGIGFLAYPTPGADPEFRTGSLDGRTTGVRVLYTRNIVGSLTGTVGYAAGRGVKLGDSSDPFAIFENQGFQMVAGQLQAEFDTGTRVTAVYRFSPDAVVFAIDPFAGRVAAFEPSASVVVYQSIPTPGFFPGRLEAMLDVRNLFDVTATSDERELQLADYSRLVRAGLSFRF
jgi:hypothetical protein